MKRKIILLSCLVVSFVMLFAWSVEISMQTASAATIVKSDSCGSNVKYTLDSDGLLTISGKGSM